MALPSGGFGAGLTSIYCLIDPITNHVRYIGKSNNPRERYLKHLKDKDLSHKQTWILGLKQKGLVPDIEIIDVVDINEWAFWEKHYMSLYRSWGFSLTNMIEGGTQPPYKCGKDHHMYGKHHSQEIREKIKRNKPKQVSPMKGRHHSDETKAKLREARYRQPRVLPQKPITEETRKKIKEARAKQKCPRIGKKHSEEVKKVISEKLKLFYNKKKNG